MKNSNHRKTQMQNREQFVFFHAYIIGYHPNPGGTCTLRARELNLKYDVFRPFPGHDVLLPSGVVYNFESLYNKRGFKSGRHIVGVLAEYFDKNDSLRNYYDVEGSLAFNETRDEKMFPASCFVV